MANIWITSDTHFNHKNIIRYTKRPFRSVRQMNNTIIRRWNQRVKKGDIVYHLGDFSQWGCVKYFKDKLNGDITLVVGNHDRNLKAMKRQGFKIRMGNVKIGKYILSHRPLEKKEIPKGFINIHGHIHEKDSFYGINVSVEKTGFHPIKLSEVKKYQPSWFKRKLNLIKYK